MDNSEKFDKYAHTLEGKEFIITTKLDGNRCVAFYNESGAVSLVTRQGLVEVVLVDRTFPSSQLDPFSGAKHPEMKNLKNKHFKCDNGLVLHRDQVAAMNILNEGKRIANLHVLSE